MAHQQHISLCVVGRYDNVMHWAKADLLDFAFGVDANGEGGQMQARAASIGPVSIHSKPGVTLEPAMPEGQVRVQMGRRANH